MPALGADMDAGAVTEWLVHPGDHVSRGDIVAVVATDKADIDVEVFENGVITDMIPMDAVNAAGYGRNFQRATGDRVIDATGQYVIPGLVEMHAHLPSPNGDLGARALDLAYRIYLGHGITTVRDAGTGAGMARMAEQRKQIEANQVVGPRLVLCLRWPQPLRQWEIGLQSLALRGDVGQGVGGDLPKEVAGDVSTRQEIVPTRVNRVRDVFDEGQDALE